MISLYLHVPFCLSKCPYCDFFSSDRHPELLASYHRSLLDHLKIATGHGWNGPVSTVFFGGGTPSLLTPDQVAAVIEGIDREFGVAADAEISMEGNPSSLSPENLSGFRRAGVNRLSIGVQSLDDVQLRRLGRRHTAAEAEAVFRAARGAGFDNLGADLMFALPGQSPEDLERDLERFLELGAEHLSCYGLTVEPGTEFENWRLRGELELPEDDRYATEYRAVHKRLSAAGYEHYEIANFAKPGKVCRHNANYWERRPCLGLGAGAHSFHPRGWGERSAVPSDLPDYLDTVRQQRDPAELLESFSREEAARETVYLALRTAEGLDGERFAATFGIPFERMFPAEIRASAPYLHRDAENWRLDLDGWLIYDHLVSRFL